MQDEYDLDQIKVGNAVLLQRNGAPRSEVWRAGEWVYKRMSKYMCDNEIYFLNRMWASGYVPEAERLDLEVVRVKYIEQAVITSSYREWMQHTVLVIQAMKQAGVRHGDLTEYSVIPHENRPVLIDWSESREWFDPRPDKRPEGDVHWLKKTMEHYAKPLRSHSG